MFRIFSAYEGAKAQDIARNVQEQRRGLTDWDIENQVWKPVQPSFVMKVRKLALAVASLITSLVLR